jgi:Transaldolase/Fructose-6-phosphate aldolase
MQYDPAVAKRTSMGTLESVGTHVARLLPGADAGTLRRVERAAQQQTFSAVSAPEDASSLNIKLFADGADLRGMLDYASNPLIKGFTTNPTLMRQAGITDYEKFAREVLSHITDRPIWFEVISDDFHEMNRQAKKLAALGPNVVVKIPVTNTRRESSGPLIAELAASGIPLNVTAVMTLDQVCSISDNLSGGPIDHLGVRRPDCRYRA